MCAIVRIEEDPTTRMSFPSRRIRIESPARLHLGFVDLNGDLGRRFGGLGLALEDLSTTVVAEPSAALRVTGDDAARAEEYARRTLRALDLPSQLTLTVENAIPIHAGLGSGTQLALAVSAAIAGSFGLNRNIRELASVTGRGQRSGIGIGVFETGGFVIDGGRAEDTVVPPLIARFAFPEDWRVLLICDDNHRGLNGVAEISAFESIEPMAHETVGELCRLTLMGIFPALIERNFESFSTHIAAIQTAIGDYFGPLQGGPFTSGNVAEAIDWIRAAHTICGVGQTSWGPTGFVFIDSESRARRILDDLAGRFGAVAGLSFSVHRGRNRGAEISHGAQTDTVSPSGVVVQSV